MSRLGWNHEHDFLSAHGSDLRAVFEASFPRPVRAANPGRIVVALLDLDEWQPWLPEAWEILDTAERQRVERRRSAAARDDLALGYALHRLLLARVMDCDAIDVPLMRDVRGCPRLREHTLWTSLTHADGAIGVALSAIGPVGIDMELAARAASMPDIAERLCHPVDAAALAGLVPPAWNAALLQIWVRKEALLKAAGIGLEREMSSFPGYEDGLFPLCSPDSQMTHVRMLDAGPGWVAAVAAPPGSPVEGLWLRPGAPSSR